MIESSDGPAANPVTTAPEAGGRPRKTPHPPRWDRRLVQLYVGLILYGFSSALMLRAGLGLDPWSVFHQGLAHRSGMTFGTATIVTGLVVMIFWIPLREKPGIGTLSNLFVIGLAADASLAVLPPIHGLALRWMLVVVSTSLTGLASASYIGAGLGPGPRDGLMTSVARLSGWPIRRVRTGIELTALTLGWLLGGTVGLATIFYAVMIGPIVHHLLPYAAIREHK